MLSIKRRVEALENYAGMNGSADADPERRAAFERISGALRGALPGASFGALIMAMHRRMHDAMMTDDDRRVLAALPADDLEVAGLTPEGVVELYGSLHAEY